MATRTVLTRTAVVFAAAALCMTGTGCRLLRRGPRLLDRAPGSDSAGLERLLVCSQCTASRTGGAGARIPGELLRQLGIAVAEAGRRRILRICDRLRQHRAGSGVRCARTHSRERCGTVDVRRFRARGDGCAEGVDRRPLEGRHRAALLRPLPRWRPHCGADRGVVSAELPDGGPTGTGRRTRATERRQRHRLGDRLHHDRHSIRPDRRSVRPPCSAARETRTWCCRTCARPTPSSTRESRTTRSLSGWCRTHWIRRTRSRSAADVRRRSRL